MPRQERIGPYEIERELGRGGMGVVLAARDPGTGRAVAIKLLNARGDVAIKRFAREAEALARLRHPGVVAVHSAGAHQGRPYVVMEFVAGESLAERVGRSGPLDPREAARVALGVALALAHVHEAGLLHRDLKPANVLLDLQGTPRLTDFGLAREVVAPSSSLTKSGMFMGTPGFWPPEQAKGDHARVGPRSDVYALGATLFAALTGGPPFGGATLVEALVATAEDPAPPPSTLVAGVPRALDAIVLRCLEKDPQARYASAQALADDLNRFLAGSELEAVLPRARGPRVVAAALALVVVAGATLAGLVWQDGTRPVALARYADFQARVLDPYALGLGSGDAPEAEALARVRSELEADRAEASPEEVRGLDAALGVIGAHQRLALGQPLSVPSRDPASNLVSALLLAQAGEASKGRAHLRRALQGPPALAGAVWGHVWALSLEAGDEHLARACLQELEGLDTAAREAPGVVEAATRAAASWLGARVREATTSGGGAVPEAAQALKADLARLYPRGAAGARVLTGARRLTLVDVQLDPRLRTLAARPRSEARTGVRELFRQLGALTRGQPTLSCPALEEALARALAAGLSTATGVTAAGDWALVLESAAFYEAGLRCEATPDYRRYLDLRLNSGLIDRTVLWDLLLAVLRHGVLDPEAGLVPKAFAARFEGVDRELIEARPTSRAARYVQFATALYKAERRPGERLPREELLVLAASALEPGLIDDLHPEYQAVLLDATADLHRLGTGSWDQERAVQAFRAAAGLARDARVLVRVQRGLVRVLFMTGRRDQAKVLLVGAVRAFRARLANTTPANELGEKEALGKTLLLQATYGGLGAEAREALLREADALLGEVSSSSLARVGARTELAGLLRLRGDLEEAEEAISPFLERIQDADTLGAEAIRISLARGRGAEAKARFAAAQRRERPAAWVADMRREFMAAGVQLD